MNARYEIEQHLKQLDIRMSELIRRDRVEGWNSYTALMQAKSTALMALSMIDKKENPSVPIQEDSLIIIPGPLTKKTIKALLKKDNKEVVGKDERVVTD